MLVMPAVDPTTNTVTTPLVMLDARTAFVTAAVMSCASP
jgi:hypothetical protein